MLNEIILSLKRTFDIYDEKFQRGNLAFITVNQINVVQVITQLKDFSGFTHLVLLTAVDWLENGQFQLTYILNNPVKKIDLAVKTMINRESASMTSIHHLWITAATYQRELKEMFGIDFPGSPRVDEEFVLEGWHNLPPYRRDFDTKKYVEETYESRPGRSTNDPKEYMKKKLYPEDK